MKNKTRAKLLCYQAISTFCLCVVVSCSSSSDNTQSAPEKQWPSEAATITTPAADGGTTNIINTDSGGTPNIINETDGGTTNTINTNDGGTPNIINEVINGSGMAIPEDASVTTIEDSQVKDTSVADSNPDGDITDVTQDAGLPPGCPEQSLDIGEQNFTINSANGITYTYIIVVPKSYRPNVATPVTIVWHALSSDPAELRSLNDYDGIAERLGFILVYPISPDKSWSVGSCCNTIVGGQTRDETVFAKELIADVKSKVCVDAKRIYTMGFSNGGMMSQMLACTQSDVFAAAAVAGSTLTIANSLTAAQSACAPSRPIPIFMINGTADPLVGYTAVSFSGGITVMDDYTLWTTANRCTDPPEQSLQKGQVTCNTYTNCEDDVEVTQCVAGGMGHCMPGMIIESDTNCLTKVALDLLPIPLGAPNNDIDGVQMSFDFLKRWSLP